MAKISCLAVLLASLLPSVCLAQAAQVTNGSDLFISGEAVLPTLEHAGDVFATGATVVLKGRAGGDVHVAGFDLTVEAPVAGDLYAAGASVEVQAPVGSDLSAAGFSLRTSGKATIAGNARLAGGVIVLDGPVEGALTAAGGEITLNATIAGDVLMTVETLNFGPDARIGGRLVVAAPKPVDVPASVVPADRVSYHRLDETDLVGDFRDTIERVRPPRARVIGWAVLVSAVSLAALVAVAALFLGLAGPTVERLRTTVQERPGLSFVAGFIGLSALFGFVPVSALTVVGIPLVPVAVFAVVVGWTLGYLLGVHVVIMRLFTAFGLQSDPGVLARLGITALGLLIAAVLNFIPVLGWMMNLALVIVGLGGLSLALVRGRRQMRGAPSASPEA